MAKLYFRYGAMNSAKSANLLMVAYNYKSQNKPVLLMKPVKDTRWGADNFITSRAIDKESAEPFSDKDDLYEIVKDFNTRTKIYAVLVDEAQFMTEEHVLQLAKVVDELDIPVLCYGLKGRAAKGKLFVGSAALLYWADSIEEIKNTCQFCNKKATQNLLLINGTPEFSPEEVVMADVEGNLKIIPVCRSHYLAPPKEEFH